VFDPRSTLFRKVPALWRGSAYVLVLAFTIFYARSPNAQIANTGRFGVWETYSGIAFDGKPVCGLSSIGGRRQMHIKHFGSNDYFTVQIFNTDWRFVERAPVRVAFLLGANYLSVDINGWAVPRRGESPPFVELAISYNTSADFWNSFRWASQGSLVFRTGNEGSWNIDLTGSNAAVSSFARCVSRLEISTQPFDPPQGRSPVDGGTKSLDTHDSMRPKSPF
jgi:hypothetical protein